MVWIRSFPFWVFSAYVPWAFAVSFRVGIPRLTVFAARSYFLIFLGGQYSSLSPSKFVRNLSIMSTNLRIEKNRMITIVLVELAKTWWRMKFLQVSRWLLSVSPGFLVNAFPFITFSSWSTQDSTCLSQLLSCSMNWRFRPRHPVIPKVRIGVSLGPPDISWDERFLRVTNAYSPTIRRILDVEVCYCFFSPASLLGRNSPNDAGKLWQTNVCVIFSVWHPVLEECW